MAEETLLSPVDFFARRTHYIDHIAPIWKRLSPDSKGIFYTQTLLAPYAERIGIEAYGLKGIVSTSLEVAPPGQNILLTAAYGDMLVTDQRHPRKKYIFMEHGVGLAFNHPGYAGGKGGVRHKVSLFLNPNDHTRILNQKNYPHIPQVVIGTPKLDRWADRPVATSNNPKPIVAISFHWPGNAAPEASNTFQHYRKALNILAQRSDFKLVGHGHPKYLDQLAQVYQSLGIEVWESFDQVMEFADVYINDCSSTMYEFLITGKPVVIMNAPHFRRNVDYGIRFWEYSDVGFSTEKPEDLLQAIYDTLEFPQEHEEQREKAVHDLYPYIGKSAQRAADAIEEFSKVQAPTVNRITSIQDQTVGIVYMCFGPKAVQGVQNSIGSLAKLGIQIPVAVVGSTPVAGTKFIEWKGQSPFDTTMAHNFQFRAGRVKPKLYRLSPFERTLYIDADTEFMADPTLGFELLGMYDMALAQELLRIGQLYNKKNAGWEINIQERDVTIEELGGDKDQFFLNSGVIFFKKSKAVEKVFERWYLEWMRFQQWDEQLALMRAIGQTDVTYKALSTDWNHPHRHLAKIIFHNYGRATVRVDGR